MDFMKLGLALFNHVLAQNPVVRADLASLAGHRLFLDIQPVRLTGVVTEEGWLAETTGEAEASIRVRPLAALQAQLTGRSPGFAAMQLNGDPLLVERFARAIAPLRWLPAEDLSRLLGDALAYRVESSVRRLVDANGKITWRLMDSLSEYLRDEAAVLGRSRDIEHFMMTVDVLRDDAERLEKRLQKLEAGRQA